ncbi:hypothetical protein C8A01DRAFT_12804 [Parachaetomium inaequale]|uniref:Uncharacterized protein n=1 Tax=Parachaetomium inaequale TaxID=2588326 RepID=A0AAN6PMQ7_9PEZI|nr:hypothetical protein C8A01DRAFT_12804 [Parachaetomium inaequale]
MAASSNPAISRSASPAPDSLPRPALGAYPGMARCFSTGSTISHGSATTDASNFRESLGSDGSAFSRHSSASYRLSDISVNSDQLRPRDSTCSAPDTPRGRSPSRRRGYMRPQGTDFAASARARESVLSLGSITHLQYYFARTGLLDGKGGRLARKRDGKAHTLDLSSLDPSVFLTPKPGSDHDSSYASMGSSPDLTTLGGFGSVVGLGPGSMVESPIEEYHPGQQDEDYFSDDLEMDPNMPPPTTSTYNYREKPVAKPPTIAELRSELTNSLDVAEQTLHEAKGAKMPPGLTIRIESADAQPQDGRRPSIPSAGWYEIQGMNILDVMTLAIRAAKIYYTSHDRPDRLDAIKSEKVLRGELLSVMDILKRMATRGFAGGMRDDEFRTMGGWIAGLRAMLTAEDAMEAKEVAERSSWAWLNPEGWEGREFEREEAFMRSMLKGPDPIENMPAIPQWTPIDRTQPLESQSLPTPFLAALSNGQRLVQLHNCAVRKSRRRFGAIPTFYANTEKPYRAADNLRYWLKAAELRWEVLLKADPLGLQYNSGPQLWVDFEDAVLQWCRKVREEIAAELREPEPMSPA